jgi:hypothetical protein
MHVQAIASQRRAKFLVLGLALVFVLACTSFAAHVDKAAGDDGKGHCSICLGGTAHIVPPMAVVQVAPVLVAAAVAPSSDPLIKQDRFASSLYIRPPPAR